jgi:hypothetical protein
MAGTACSGSGESRTSSDPDVITQEQIQEASTMSSAYALVQRLRPMWLRKRGTSSINNAGFIVVYVEGSRRGPPEALRRIQVLDVESMRFLSAAEATNRYGAGHDNGVIQVDLKGQ